MKRRPILRIIFIIAWTIASLFAYIGLIAIALKPAISTAVRYRSDVTHEGAFEWCVYAVVFGGVCVIPPIFAFLGMRGRLPWTRKEPRAKPRGFPLDG